jgi:hypothetical protein
MREHAAEFKLLDGCRQIKEVDFDGLERGVILFIPREIEQILQVARFAVDGSKGQDDVLNLALFPPEFLSARGVAPCRRVFERAVDFFKLRRLGFVVKDTSAIRARAR